MQVVTDAAIAAAPTYNETEIRFHILDPIIRALGYCTSDDTYLFMEHRLGYPYMHIGHRSKKDVPLGFADYFAGVKGARGSFVVEAKAGNVAITARDIEQAHSYAAHAEVGANYFVLCNGEKLTIHETLSGLAAVPLVEMPLSDLNIRFHEIANILEPANLVKNCRVVHDKGLRLAPGLPSSVRVRSGTYELSDYSIKYMMADKDITAIIRRNFPEVSEIDRQLDTVKTTFQPRVEGGVIERDENGKICLRAQFQGITIPNSRALKILGINEISFVTADAFISIDPEKPTIFESDRDLFVPSGTKMPQLLGEVATTEADLLGNMFTRAAVRYADGTLTGEYTSRLDQYFAFQGAQSIKLEAQMFGEFELLLDD